MQKNARLISSLMISTALIGTAAPALAVDALETPMGGNVVAGNSNINYGAPGQVTINQNSDRTVINWDSFNIGQDAGAEFVQPNTNSLAVNRVTGAGTDPTQILGSLRANGRVMVLDRNGVIFGKQARVDVGGIIASTGDVNNAQVMSGANRIELTQNGSTGTVENRGQITVSEGGLAALVAPTVRNSGTINARLGRVGLASGDKVTVDLYGDNLIEMEVNGTAQRALVEQTGTIVAEGGLVQISTRTAKDVVDNVINLNGVTNVSSVSQQGGRIVLSGGTVNVSGTVNAAGRRGGSVRVDAQRLNMASTASVSVNSTANEAAGRVDLIASEAATFNGTVTALGAAGTGFVETSAPAASFGDSLRVLANYQWLIDPTNLTIDAALAASLALQLNTSGSISLATPAGGAEPGNIFVDATVTWNTANSITLTAHNDILFGAAGGLISTGGGNVNLTAARNVLVAGNGIHTNGGNIAVTTRRFRLNSNEVNAGGGNITINNWGGFQALANSIKTSGTGTVTYNQNKDADAFLSSNTIKNAIDALDNTGAGINRLSVGRGTWTENVVIDHANLKLLGRNAGVAGYNTRAPETVISAAGTAFTVTANNSSVNGFLVDGATVAVNANGVSDVEVSNNIFTNTVSDTIRLTNAPLAFVNRNLITGAGGNGVLLNNADGAIVVSNRINTVKRSAINANLSDMLTVDRNIIHTTGSHGISVINASSLQILTNYVGYTDAGVTAAPSGNIQGNGINITGSINTDADRSYILGNKVAGTSSTAWYTGSGIYVFGSSFVDIGGAGAPDGNTVSDTAWDGIHARGSSDINITGNSASNAARTGIFVGTTDRANIDSNTVDGTGIFGIQATTSSAITASNNTVSNTTDDGIRMGTINGVSVLGNTVTNAGDDGIQVHDGQNVDLSNNIVNTPKTRGIVVSGGSTTNVTVAGNTVTDAPVGMHFEAGTIDMTGAANTLNGGNVGLRFSGGLPSLVGNTIGTTRFNGQATYYVELRNGALYAPGSPTLIDGLNAVYDGLNPALTGGALTPLQVAALEGKIWHFNDDGTLGLFFFGSVPLPLAALNFEDEDAFGSFVPPAGRVGLTIAGLPRIPGSPAPAPTSAPNDITNPDVLNTLAPAAGGEQEPTAEQVAAIAPAAGGQQNASCWSDATSLASAGQTVNYNFSTDASSALADAAACGTNTP